MLDATLALDRTLASLGEPGRLKMEWHNIVDGFLAGFGEAASPNCGSLRNSTRLGVTSMTQAGSLVPHWARKALVREKPKMGSLVADTCAGYTFYPGEFEA